MELRDYQINAKDAIFKEWENGNKRTLLNMATGLGKTVVFAKVIEEFVKHKKRVLIIAHREELLEQAANKIKAITGYNCVYEKAKSTCIGSRCKIVLGSIQTISKKNRLSKFKKDYFDLIVVDEAHHCTSATYQNVLKYFDNAYVLGVTATPDRSDKKMLSSYFNSEAYEYNIRDGIQNKYLCPIKAKTIPLVIDISDVKISSGDFSLSDADRAIEPYLEEVANVIATEYADKKIVIFLPLVNTSIKMCEILQSKGVSAVEINGKSPDRAQKFKDYAEGKYSVLCNAMLATEGWDCPAVDCIVILRPTKVRSFYVQMVGRGTRPYKDKNNLLLLDFLWLSQKHKLCRPSSLFSKTEEQFQLMQKNIHKTTEPLDLVTLADDVEMTINKNREEALAKQLAKMRGRKARLIDPLQFFVSGDFNDLLNYEPIFEWEKSKPTENQLRMLERNGFDTSVVTTRGLASKIIEAIITRVRLNLSTPKQIRCLENYGFEHVAKWTFKEANYVLNKISNNDWCVPSYITPATYKPYRLLGKVNYYD